ncbi:MAG: hypothetical protein N2691_03480 [Patescibacteria group bacterium]|nr:hypothetical protein [Patescibacteria group bacterium]
MNERRHAVFVDTVSLVERLKIELGQTVFADQRLREVPKAFFAYLLNRETRAILPDIERHLQLISAYPIEQQTQLRKFMMLAVVGHQFNSIEKARLRKEKDAEGNNYPYAKHVLDVAGYLLEQKMDYRSVMAAYGHDLGEDSELEPGHTTGAGLTAEISVDLHEWPVVFATEAYLRGTDDHFLVPHLIDAVTEATGSESESENEDALKLKDSPICQTIIKTVAYGGLRILQSHEALSPEDESELKKLSFQCSDYWRLSMSIPVLFWPFRSSYLIYGIISTHQSMFVWKKYLGHLSG